MIDNSKLPAVLAVGLVLLLLAGMISCRSQEERPAPENRFPPREMAAFALPALPGGETVASDRFRDRVMLVTFFATWCQACLEEIETMKKLQRAYSGRGLVVLGISVDAGDTNAMANLIRQAEISYPVLQGNEAIRKNFGPISVIPTAFLVNRQGMIVRKYVGNLARRSLGRDIEEMLEGSEE